MAELNEANTGAGAILSRDMRLIWRHRSDIVNPVIFYLIGITMLPLAIGTSKQLLGTVAPGMLWIMAMLATLLSLDALFRTDFEDGSLAQFQLSSQPLYLIVLYKVLAYWLSTGLPLTLMAPMLGLMLSLPADGYWALLLTLLPGTAILTLVGALGAALTVCLRSGGLVMTLIIMPLYLPVLIIGSSAVSSAVAGFGFDRELALLIAGLAIALIVMPPAIAGALKISTNQ
ncbi:heme exporter protein CcmB [Gilvimarinus agarilyticus]|uniref:heme exporter protein CcmB n=1 Tax=Gilvimarinus sp. 2_MG-2023 TaxID=3062666 RepID=UPI001C08DB38|nr:heme exporter protein CcmB [Gilvimarinus sp. 2_MG-2023]MBU2887128.1 heme exporter protein CcmB [Gilvimarinus agarilyticus]MDO6571787.1 heme exporter protein CcmB [Gilvimarinus sp. 2_MG-2023]